jgi:hypothetical protein
MNGLQDPPIYQEPQFIFGLIIVAAWLIFMVVLLSFFHSTADEALTVMERVSALFTTALGFVWGFYFGGKNGQQLIRQLRSRINDLEQRLR